VRVLKKIEFAGWGFADEDSLQRATITLLTFINNVRDANQITVLLREKNGASWLYVMAPGHEKQQTYNGEDFKIDGLTGHALLRLILGRLACFILAGRHFEITQWPDDSESSGLTMVLAPHRD